MLAAKTVGQGGAAATNAAQLRRTLLGLNCRFSHAWKSKDSTQRVAPDALVRDKQDTQTPLPLFPQIAIRLINPICAGRSEDVNRHGIFERLGFVWHIRRDGEHFPCADNQLFAIDPEL